MTDVSHYRENEQHQTLNEAAGKYFSASPLLRESLQQDVINAAGPMIIHYIRIYGGNTNREDLLQAGMEGLLKALIRFNPEGGASFTTYASHCIIGEIRHYVRKESRYYIPRSVIEVKEKADDYILQHLQDYGEAPSLNEISMKIGVNEEGVGEVMNHRLISLDDLDVTRIKSTEYKSFQMPVEDRIALWNSMRKLSDIQKKVISMLFFKGMSQQQVAKKLGTNQRQVSRIKVKSLELLKQMMESE